ncbi:HAD-IIB family hydrolase [Oryzobacter terrae]|uniref:HAD-IIB family hydrolase n=1 Tax=Oryzobacter terrae TaxID=1620385 RepID=UPI003672A2D2
MNVTTDPIETKLVAFDLDDTLAPSKTPIGVEMAAALLQLLDGYEVLVISGGNVGQFRTQLLQPLGGSEQLARLHLMPTCGTRYLRFDSGEWVEVYALDLPERDRVAAAEVLECVARTLGLWEPDAAVRGPRIEDRGTQVTFSALGQQAPPELKRTWDPDGSKRESLRRAVAALLPGLEVRSGGSTSIDVTAHGVDKAYGMSRMLELRDLDPRQVLFVGDRLDPGGNDHPVIATGVRTRAVRDEDETLEVIHDLLAPGTAGRSSTVRAPALARDHH